LIAAVLQKAVSVGLPGVNVILGGMLSGAAGVKPNPEVTHIWASAVTGWVIKRAAGSRKNRAAVWVTAL
jgi:hypothetical protein